jgi:hypothetical protein
VRPALAVAAALAVTGAALAAQAVPETFTATASVRSGEVVATAPVVVTITRYAAPAERDAVLAAIRGGGAAAVRTLLAASEDAGFVQVGGRKTAIKFAGERPTSSGRLVTVVTGEPIVHLGAGLPSAKARDEFAVGVAILTLDGTGGLGELAPAAKVGVDAGGALLIEDYGPTVVWLNGLTRAR